MAIPAVSAAVEPKTRTNEIRDRFFTAYLLYRVRHAELA
jgi:hypothetical protein